MFYSQYVVSSTIIVFLTISSIFSVPLWMKILFLRFKCSYLMLRNNTVRATTIKVLDVQISLFGKTTQNFTIFDDVISLAIHKEAV